MMIERAVDYGLLPGYVLFDSWYAWPCFINKIRNIADKGIHVICRLKNGNIKYLYKNKCYTLEELYKKVRKKMKRDRKTGLFMARIRVRFSNSEQVVVIVFSKGYKEPEDDTVKGWKKKKLPKWEAFLSTDATLHSSTVIKKYI